MKKILLIIGASLPFILLISWFFSNSTEISDTSNEPFEFPLTEPTGQSNNQTPSVTLVSGESAFVNDFINNGETIDDVVNPGRYVLAGKLDYCLANGDCPQGAIEPQFDIAYSSQDDFFTVTLMQEPLSESRLAAEIFLQTRLGLTQSVMCDLNYVVSTPYFVNQFLAGNDVRFSFCPDSYEL